MREVELGKRKIGAGHPCFIIAEAGINHNGSLDKALQLVDAAAAAGADGIKFQLYRAEEQVSALAGTVDYQKERTGNSNALNMSKNYDLPWEAHYIIAGYCRDRGIDYMASCFDPEAVDFLKKLGGGCIKVGSGEITNYPLLASIVGSGLPILLSTGMSTLQDVAGAVEFIRQKGSNSLVLFQCASNYPAAPEEVNLRAMNTLAEAFKTPVGYSDHTLGDRAAVAAVALGACMIEKHFTLDRTLPGPDHSMSLLPRELIRYVQVIRETELLLGDGIKRPYPDELPVLKAVRRSLVAARTIKTGECLDDHNVTLKRPGTGIDPRLWEAVRGRQARITIAADAVITWEMLL